MRHHVRLWRVLSFGREASPWRADLEQTRRDAAYLGLGSYDERGVWYTTVPGDIQMVELPRRLLMRIVSEENADEPSSAGSVPDHTAEHLEARTG